MLVVARDITRKLAKVSNFYGELFGEWITRTLTFS
jgi:hypothetical protein